MVSWSENFVFNDELLGLKDYILCCFAEYGWNANLTDTHIWGKNSESFPRYYNGDWIKFDSWVTFNPPKLLLKRELLKKDVTDTVKPIEYPCLIAEYETQSKEDFNARQISVFQYWGRSNEHRMRIHAEVLQYGYDKGFQVCDNLFYVKNYYEQELGEKWVTLWIPHWARVDIVNLIAINGLSKLSLSWEGAGFKCFRHMESPVNAAMVMHENDYAWTFDWDSSNCVLVEHRKEIESIQEVLKNENLYDIYVKGMDNVNKYRLPQYTNHLEATINAAI